jgi:hypothetical protein
MLEIVLDIAQSTHGIRNIFADIRNVPTRPHMVLGMFLLPFPVESSGRRLPPERDAGEGSDSCIDLGVKVEEGRKVDVELRIARKEPDASGDRCSGGDVRHAQIIAKLLFSVRSTQFLFKLNILFIKKIYQPLGPQNTPF